MSSTNLKSQSLQNQLEAGLKKLELQLDLGQKEKLLSYIELLQKWSKVFNLTAIKDPEKILVKHILDSLAIAHYLPDGNCLDVGTGAGLPGVPLSIVYPEKQFTLLDSNSKKIKFVRQVLIELKLANIELKHERVEQLSALSEGIDYSSIVSRAFSSLKLMLELCYPLRKPQGSIIAMKGKITDSEMAELKGLSIRLARIDVKPIEVPFLNEERHLVIMQ